MLDEALPVRTVRAHCTDKPWMTPNIKALIKARQRAFTKGETPKYKSLHAKVTKLISNAKATYYKSKAEGNHQSNPAKCIVQCKYPTSYKHAIISPIPKIRPLTDLDNDFRQVSVLPQLAKVIEKLQLQLNKSSFKIKTNQHAFTSGHSTVSALTSISQNWFDSTDNSSTGRQGVHALFVDFRKAFDLVDHKFLLDKLADMNVTRSFWLWTMSFLEGRTQQVNLQGVLSFTASCPAGVPQGSAISPTLFNIHINDMEENVSEQACVNTIKYADDCTMDTSIRLGEFSDLQSALDSVQSWAVENKMELNVKKTKDMWINFIEAPPPLPLHIGDAIIERVDNFKLLGVDNLKLFQKDLKWNKHVEETTRKAAKNLYCLRECRRANLPVEVGLTTYLTKIRPILEYCFPVWGGLPRYLKDELERAQRKSLRIIGLPHGYLPTLEERRIEATSRELVNILGIKTTSFITMPFTKPTTNNTFNSGRTNLQNANGDNSDIYLSIILPILVILTLLVLVGAILYWRRRNKENNVATQAVQEQNQDSGR
ncbi:Hypothetical predicted protein [Paramuricea clavata]|nr:Hypothetical predicted protein [Paramuricea clavata]